MLTILSADAMSINEALKESNINESAVSISVKDIQTGKKVYHLNDKQPMNPASTLKVLTLASSLDKLGKNYEFSQNYTKTQIMN